MKFLNFPRLNLNFQAYKHLIKPSLKYFGVCCLAASAALYYAESTAKVQNISNEIPSNPRILKINKDLYVAPVSELQNVYLDKSKLPKT